jgi:hypothetical protein
VGGGLLRSRVPIEWEFGNISGKNGRSFAILFGLR